MIRPLKALKRMALTAAFGRWRNPRPVDREGYAILLPMPEDMPFLLRYALEGLRDLDTSHCGQILVIPDGCGADGGAGLRRVAGASDDPRVEFVGLRPSVRLAVRGVGPARRMAGSKANWAHWATIIEGTTKSRCSHVFLHDADAFFLESGGLERQYAECRDRGSYSLGVTARWDPYFERIGYSIPGTWELMFSTRWARSRDAFSFKGQERDTIHGRHTFDTMLFPQYLDYASGRVAVMPLPPRLVHFSGTITTYREFRDSGGKPVVDELFRLLLLALLEELMPPGDGCRTMPTIAELARGLDAPEAQVCYGTEAAAAEYAGFRGMVEQLCEAAIFCGDRAERIRALLRPFDRHFEAELLSSQAGGPAPRPVRKMRLHGLGQQAGPEGLTAAGAAHD